MGNIPITQELIFFSHFHLIGMNSFLVGLEDKP